MESELWHEHQKVCPHKPCPSMIYNLWREGLLSRTSIPFGNELFDPKVKDPAVDKGVCLACGSAVLDGEHLRDDLEPCFGRKDCPSCHGWGCNWNGGQENECGTCHGEGMV